MTGAEIAIASMVLTAVGTGVAVYGQIQAGNAAKEAAEYDAKLKENEAIAIQHARDANKILEHKQSVIRRGRDENAAGSSGAQGFDDIFRDDVYTYESSALIADYNASIGVYNKKGEAAAIRYEGEALKAKSRTDALATGIQGMGKLADQAQDFKGTQKTTLGGP